jgi:transketolase
LLQVLNALAEALPELVGGSADLAGSNCTNLKVSERTAQENSPYSAKFVRRRLRPFLLSHAGPLARPESDHFC